MNEDLRAELLDTYSSAIQPPYTGSFRQWSEDNISLPPSYATNGGRLDLSISPYLHEPMKDMDNDNIKQVNLIMATQIGKSMYEQLAVPYLTINRPGPILMLLHTNEIMKKFAASHVIPLLKNCEPTNTLLKYKRNSTKLTSIEFPNITVTMGGANDGFAHGLTIKYLLADEVHQWDDGMLDKTIARTTAFAGKNRKIIVASQPNEKGKELERVYLSGRIYEWQWTCPSCSLVQPFTWSKEREDGSFYGFNMVEKVYEADNETLNIAASAKSTVLECQQCKHQISDTPPNRLYLNDTGKYVCIKNDGAADVVSYTCPNFVNKDLKFESAMSQYLLAKRAQKAGVDEPMMTFVNQVLGKFYKADPVADLNQTLTVLYTKDDINDEWITTMGVDYQRLGGIKYYAVRAWNKKGNESRRLDFGVVRTWDEIAGLMDKYKIPLPLVGVDSGFQAEEVYQECIRAGNKFKIIKNVHGQLEHIGWTIFKGDGTHQPWKHSDGVVRLYSPPTLQDAKFNLGSKFRGIPAKLVHFHSTSIQRILANLRDNQIPGIKWMIDTTDKDYISQLYAEGFAEIENKKTGIKEMKWVVKSDNNHYFDTEKMNLVLAIMAKAFTFVDLETPKT